MGLSMNELRVRPHILDRGLVVGFATSARDLLDFAVTTVGRSDRIRNMLSPFRCCSTTLKQTDRSVYFRYPLRFHQIRLRQIREAISCERSLVAQVAAKAEWQCAR